VPQLIAQAHVVLIYIQQGVCPEGPSINEHEQELEGPQREPSAGHNYQVRRAQSEATSSSSPNRHLAEDDAR
jgi:hypothetical protein